MTSKIELLEWGFLLESAGAFEQCSTVVTTNRPFAEWNEVFPNAACVVSLIDRLIQHSQIIAIEGDSYRMKEAQDQATQR